MSKPIFLKAAALTLLTLGLAACGGSGNNDGAGPGAGGPAQDSFFATVNGVIATTSEATEPREIDSVAATAPEDSEPSALDS